MPDMNLNPIQTAEGVTYYPWTDGHAVGFRAVAPDGRVEFLYLNPSSESDDGQPNVFLYHEGNTAKHDGPVCFVDMFATA